MSGPPSFVFDRLLASDFLAWAIVRIAPQMLVRMAGVAAALDAQVTPEFRERVVDWFLPAAARHVGLGHDMATTTPVAPDLPIEQLRIPVLLVSSVDNPYTPPRSCAIRPPVSRRAGSSSWNPADMCYSARKPASSTEVLQFLQAQPTP